MRIQLTNSRGKALKKQKTIVIGDPETFGHNQTYTSDENGMITTGSLLYDTWDVYYDGLRQKGVVLVNGDSQNTVQEVAMGKPSNRRPGEPVLTNKEQIIVVSVLSSVFIVAAIIFALICYKKKWCQNVFMKTLEYKQDETGLLESGPVSYTLPEPKKSEAK